MIFKKYLFIYVFLTALCLHCWAQSFSSGTKWGLLLLGVHGLLTVVYSFYCRAWALGSRGFSSCSSWAPKHRLMSCGTLAQLPHGMRVLPGPGIKPGGLLLNWTTKEALGGASYSLNDCSNWHVFNIPDPVLTHTLHLSPLILTMTL